MTRNSSILWGGLSLLSLGYTAYRFLESDEISTIGTLGFLLGAAGIAMDIYKRNREQSKKTEGKPKKEKAKPRRSAKEPVVIEPEPVVTEPRRRGEPEEPLGEVIWNRQYWDKRMEIDQRSFYKDIMNLTGWRGDEPELGLLEKLVGPIHRGNDDTDTPRDRFSDHVGKYDELKDSLTYDNIGQLWPEELIRLLSQLKDNMGYYLSNVIPDVEARGGSFQPGRKEFLTDVYDRVGKIEHAYRSRSSSIKQTIERLREQDDDTGETDSDSPGLTLSDIAELMNSSNSSLLYALRRTKIHLSNNRISGSDEYSYWKKRNPDESGNRPYSRYAKRIFDAYDSVLSMKTE